MTHAGDDAPLRLSPDTGGRKPQEDTTPRGADVAPQSPLKDGSLSLEPLSFEPRAAPVAPDPSPQVAAPVPAVPDVPDVPDVEVQLEAPGAPGVTSSPPGPTVSDPAEAQASPWVGILLTPLASGVWPATVTLLLLMALVAWFEGGATLSDEGFHAWIRAGFLIPAVAMLGIYMRRVTQSTVDGRAIPYLADEADPLPWRSAAGHFIVVLTVSMAPIFVLLALNALIGFSPWILYTLIAMLLVPAALHLPFAHAAVTLRSDALAAFPGRSVAAWRANRQAAKITVKPAYVFFALIVLSVVLSGLFQRANRHEVEILSDEQLLRADAANHTPLRDLGRIMMLVIRGGAVWAALVMARVAGLVARDVPEIREVLLR